jgi:hypothetical protein
MFKLSGADGQPRRLFPTGLGMNYWREHRSCAAGEDVARATSVFMRCDFTDADLHSVF